MPSEPRSLEIFIVNSSSVTLQWSPPGAPNGIITQYSIKLDGTDVTIQNSNVLMYTIGGLSSDTVHMIGLTAYTSAGEGPPNIETVVTRKLLNAVPNQVFN